MIENTIVQEMDIDVYSNANEVEFTVEPLNTKSKVAIASFIGTTIEFYDFYIYGFASALFIGPLFFPSKDPTLEIIAVFLAFGVAYIARPFGSIFFGHYGDKLGRKTTLVLSLLCMGLCTTFIGFLPTYSSIGIWAPILLCLMRFGQGFGIGGEWGGAALLATENAPSNKRAIYGMFPQLGPSIGFMLSTLTFIILGATLSKESLYSWGWRIPFVVSFALVLVGLYVRLSLVESKTFQKMEETNNKLDFPVVDLFKNHFKPLFLGTIAATSCFILFVIITVFYLQYKTTPHPWLTKPLFNKTDLLWIQITAVLFMTLAAPVTAYLSEKYGRRKVLLVSGFLSILYGCFYYGYGMSSANYFNTYVSLALGFFIIGALFSPLGAYLPELFPTNVRYTGAALSFSLAGIFGGALTPFICAVLVKNYAAAGVYYIGLFLAIGSLISMMAVYFTKETKNVDFMK